MANNSNKYYKPPSEVVYDTLVRFKLKPHTDFEFIKKSDPIMRVWGSGVKKLVNQHYNIKSRGLHVSLLPDDNGVVNTALVSAADRLKRPGFWHVILDGTGRPVAEHPLTYSKRVMEPHEPTPPISPAPGSRAVETTGPLAQILVSWFIGYDRVNDEDSAKVLEILSEHFLSPREVSIELKTRALAQRLHDELICFEEDIPELQETSVQAAELRRRIALLLKDYPV